jgi:hypothetical protein
LGGTDAPNMHYNSLKTIRGEKYLVRGKYLVPGKNMIDRDVELETWIDKLLVVVLVPGARRWFIQP